MWELQHLSVNIEFLKIVANIGLVSLLLGKARKEAKCLSNAIEA